MLFPSLNESNICKILLGLHHSRDYTAVSGANHTYSHTPHSAGDKITTIQLICALRKK